MLERVRSYFHTYESVWVPPCYSYIILDFLSMMLCIHINKDRFASVPLSEGIGNASIHRSIHHRHTLHSPTTYICLHCRDVSVCVCMSVCLSVCLPVSACQFVANGQTCDSIIISIFYFSLLLLYSCYTPCCGLRLLSFSRFST